MDVVGHWQARRKRRSRLDRATPSSANGSCGKYLGSPLRCRPPGGCALATLTLWRQQLGSAFARSARRDCPSASRASLASPPPARLAVDRNLGTFDTPMNWPWRSPATRGFFSPVVAVAAGGPRVRRWGGGFGLDDARVVCADSKSSGPASSCLRFAALGMADKYAAACVAGECGLVVPSATCCGRCELPDVL